MNLPIKLLAFLSMTFFSCGVQHHFASSAEQNKDTSYVYALPFPEGRSHFLIQGYNSRFSHKDRLALDFSMKKGTPVTAARSGTVVRLEQRFKKGGIGKKYLHKGNLVVLLHSDGSQAYYGHLAFAGVRVSVGDTVHQGQLIALSGSTGYAAFPHLHFIVWGPSPNGTRMPLPTRFKTQKGIEYLKPGKKYHRMKNL